jgi:hypothetical protein
MEDRIRNQSSDLARFKDSTTAFSEDQWEKSRGRLRWVSQLMVPGRCEWDMNVLRSCLLPHDVEEVRKIRLSDRITEDVIA